MPERHPTHEEVAAMSDEELLRQRDSKEWMPGDRTREKLEDEIQRRGIELPD